MTGLALPGRADEVVRVSVVRRFPGKPVGIGSICLSLVLLGLIDNAAMTPLAATTAGVGAPSGWIRAGLIVVAVAGVLAGAFVAFLPRLVLHRRVARFKFVGWLAEHAASPREAANAWGLVAISWVLRVLAVFVLLDALSVGTSMPLAMGFLCASASAAALPIAPAGGVAQAGAGAAILVSAGVHASEAAAFAIAAQGMIVLAGAGVIVLTTSAHLARSRFRALRLLEFRAPSATRRCARRAAARGRSRRRTRTHAPPPRASPPGRRTRLRRRTARATRPTGATRASAPAPASATPTGVPRGPAARRARTAAPRISARARRP